MSAYLQKEDKEWLKSIIKQGKFSNLEEALILASFDEQTEYDISAINQSLLKESFLKKVCFYKLILFPLEVSLIFFILGKNKSKDHTKLTKIYYNYYRKKLSLKEFQSKLKEYITYNNIL